MSSGTLISAAQADAAALLMVLRYAARSIDFTAAVAAATEPSSAVDVARVPSLSLLARIDAARTALPLLVVNPATLAATLAGLVQGFAKTGVDMRGLADQLASVTWSWPWIWDGPHAVAIATNRAALQQLMVNQALIEAVRGVVTMTFDSQDAAFALGTDLATRIDVALRDVTTRAMRAALRALKAALVADIDLRAAQLSALESWINPGEAPALVLASRIYDDPGRAAEIAVRNACANRLFVPAGGLTILTPTIGTGARA